MYLFVEMFTIADAVSGMWRPWAVTTQIEALKIWAYALAVSVLLDLYEIVVVYSKSLSSAAGTTISAPDGAEKIEEKDQDQVKVPSPMASDFSHDAKRRQLYRQLVIDSCDLLTPTVAVGWVLLDPIIVGAAGSISALIGGSDVWARVNI